MRRRRRPQDAHLDIAPRHRGIALAPFVARSGACVTTTAAEHLVFDDQPAGVILRFIDVRGIGSGVENARAVAVPRAPIAGCGIRAELGDFDDKGTQRGEAGADDGDVDFGCPPEHGGHPICCGSGVSQPRHEGFLGWRMEMNAVGFTESVDVWAAHFEFAVDETEDAGCDGAGHRCLR